MTDKHTALGAISASLRDVRSARALHRAEDIGSALKGGVNVCQRQLVKEVLGLLVTEFVRNFGREGATPIQHGSNASLLGRVQVVKLIRAPRKILLAKSLRI